MIDHSGNLSNFDIFNGKDIRGGLNFLTNLTVRLNTTRVELVPFGTTASRFYDGISNPSSEKPPVRSIWPVFLGLRLSFTLFTNWKSAFQLAVDVCIGKYSANNRVPLNQVKTVVDIFLTHSDWNWPNLPEDPSPVFVARELHQANVEVFAIGIGNQVSQQKLQMVVPKKRSEKSKHSICKAMTS